MITNLTAWAQATTVHLRNRLATRGEQGATTLEYVVIAAAVFVAAVTLVGIIIGVINREQSNIQ
ncbi:hypothetical protein [Jiangella rhizosphaerae]|uniref:Flp family type IVb pilin n=1 Tax=Jiangella rhizosphaerae TaxID=2293569 RepID=A0A418KI49_9ACTN|nr:hypothetical protein [Jiangella rhizosphaerae]RIQ12224.1 hypothetical protein DY240_27415 [Jiangella rhizosphaerae]